MPGWRPPGSSRLKASEAWLEASEVWLEASEAWLEASIAWLEAPETWLEDSEAQLGGGRTDVRTGGQTDGQIFPYCTGLASPLGPLPKKELFALSP